jgi:molybdopterin-guanine dinucleotide biosynthesis protein A
VSGLATAIVAARGERVVVMPVEAASAGAELALALVAWPERAVVAVIDDAVEASFCGIHRRADLVERARSVLDETRPVPSLAAFLSGLEVERVDLAQLGLADRPLMLFTGSEAR